MADTDDVWLLDLFCGAGGATRGYQLAGFKVVGIDINPQPNYCGDLFVQGDALDEALHAEACGWLNVVAVHASPPCQLHSTLKTVLTAEYHDLVDETRDLLQAIGLPYVIENVVGAPLLSPTMLCGTAFGCIDEDTELRRHRLFETSWLVLGAPRCAHSRARRPMGVYGHLANIDRPNRPVDGPTGAHGWKAGRARARRLMGVDWHVTDRELSESIPPAFTEYLGHQLAALLPGHLRS